MWSCAYDGSDVNYIYAGTLNNKLFVFDVRKPSEAVVPGGTDLTTLPGHAPICDLENLDGYLLGRTQEAIFHVPYEDARRGDFSSHLSTFASGDLASESSCTSLCGLQGSFTATFRIGNISKICLFTMEQQQQQQQKNAFEISHCFSAPFPQHNSSRSCLFQLPCGRLLVNGVDESSGLHCIWDVSEIPENLVFSFPFPSLSEIHLKDSVSIDGGRTLCSLTGDSISFYQHSQCHQ